MTDTYGKDHFIGWGIIGEPKPGLIVDGHIDVTGYNTTDYWDGDRFRGPDDFGIVPVYRAEDGSFFPRNARIYPHWS